MDLVHCVADGHPEDNQNRPSLTSQGLSADQLILQATLGISFRNAP